MLSTERAVNTYRELIAVSPSLRLLRNNRNEEVISVSGYSSTRPIDPRALRDAWDRNRRIDLRFVMDNDPRRNLEHILHVTDEMRAEITSMPPFKMTALQTTSFPGSGSATGSRPWPCPRWSSMEARIA